MNSLIDELHQKQVTLVAVSKGRSPEEILPLYQQGIRDFGENRVTEALEKMALLPTDIRWHFIGRLQKNKVAKVIGKFELIHSVDSVELAQKIHSYGLKQRILLQVNTSGELTKGGLSPQQWLAYFPQIAQLSCLQIDGLMTMAPNTTDEQTIRHCFRRLKEFQSELESLAGHSHRLETLSMGMSQDYQIAIEEGATLVRIGRALF